MATEQHGACDVACVHAAWSAVANGPSRILPIDQENALHLSFPPPLQHSPRFVRDNIGDMTTK